MRKAEASSASEDVNSLARLEPMEKVGGKADTCGGLLTGTALLQINKKAPYQLGANILE